MSLSSLSWRARREIKYDKPTMSTAFNPNDDPNELIVMVADSDSNDGVVMHRLDKNYGLSSDHRVSAQFPTAIKVWRIKSDDNWHLAISNSNDVATRTRTFKSTTTFYVWSNTFFDHYMDIPSYLGT